MLDELLHTAALCAEIGVFTIELNKLVKGRNHKLSHKDSTKDIKKR